MKNFTRSVLAAPVLLLTTQLAAAQTVYQAISIIGPAAVSWNTDVPLMLVAPSNVHQWTTTLQLRADEFKFRANNTWNINWGAAAFPTGVGTQDGPNIRVATAGYYKVTFDDQTGAYQILPAPLSTTPASSTALALSLAPNPAHADLKAAYDLPAAATVVLSVRNSLGQLVGQLPGLKQAAGRQTQQLSQLNLSAGIYLVQVQADAQSQTARLIVE